MYDAPPAVIGVKRDTARFSNEEGHASKNMIKAGLGDCNGVSLSTMETVDDLLDCNCSEVAETLKL